jgi:hypothetical protein
MSLAGNCFIEEKPTDKKEKKKKSKKEKIGVAEASTVDHMAETKEIPHH